MKSTVLPILADNKATVRIVTNIIQNALTYAKSYLKISFVEEEEYIWLRAVNDVEKINVTELNGFLIEHLGWTLVELALILD